MRRSRADCRFYYQANGNDSLRAYDLRPDDKTYKNLMAVLERMAAHYEE